jgi:hypothetical protein
MGIVRKVLLLGAVLLCGCGGGGSSGGSSNSFAGFFAGTWFNDVPGQGHTTGTVQFTVEPSGNFSGQWAIDGSTAVAAAEGHFNSGGTGSCRIAWPGQVWQPGTMQMILQDPGIVGHWTINAVDHHLKLWRQP